MSEAERLNEYYPFDTAVAERVAEVAEEQRASSWDDISSQLPEIKRFHPTHGNAIDVLDIIPRHDFDGVYVYYTPMSIPLDENMAMRIAALATAEPNKRVIAIGNPGAPGQNSGKLRGKELATVWSGNLRPTVEPSLQYLSKQGIVHTVQIGFSYGADKAVSAARYAINYDQLVTDGVFMEPVSIKARSLLELGRDFMNSGAALQGYVDAAACEPLDEARQLAGKRGHGFPGYISGLMRMSNIAVAHALTKDGFEARAAEALRTQDAGTDALRANIIWGTESELVSNDLMTGIIARLTGEYGEARVRNIAVEGGKHAMGDDIYLHTALVLQALQ